MRNFGIRSKKCLVAKKNRTKYCYLNLYKAGMLSFRNIHPSSMSRRESRGGGGGEVIIIIEDTWKFGAEPRRDGVLHK